MTNDNAVVEVSGLPDAPVDALAAFHRDHVSQIRSYARQGDVAVVFEPADHTHQGWRLAIIQELAREAAPYRVNAVVGEDTQGASDTLYYLQSAKGITGQIFTLAE